MPAATHSRAVLNPRPCSSLGTGLDNSSSRAAVLWQANQSSGLLATNLYLCSNNWKYAWTRTPLKSAGTAPSTNRWNSADVSRNFVAARVNPTKWTATPRVVDDNDTSKNGQRPSPDLTCLIPYRRTVGTWTTGWTQWTQHPSLRIVLLCAFYSLHHMP